MGSLILGSFLHISIHALLAESDHNAARGVPVNTISIHALLAESDQAAGAVQFQIDIFLSTLSLRRATSDQSIASGQYLFLSTLSLRRATVSRRAEFRLLSPISIHALLAESDLIRPAPALPPQRISIHALLAESDAAESAKAAAKLAISIHALLAESDFLRAALCDPQTEFLSTLSLRRATYIGPEMEDANGISIHALLAESDHPPAPQRRWQPYFYPRSPCGERPVWRLYKYAKCSISIHALLAESDFASLAQSSRLRIFLSTLSLRRATGVFIAFLQRVSNFYPRSPCGERLEKVFIRFHFFNFYPRSPCGERLNSARDAVSSAIFLSTLSLRRATIS